MKVVVVGAGTAGLVATRELRSRGFEVVTLEKDEAAGGRIAGVSRDGFLMDLGAQFFTRYYRATFDIIRDVGLGEDLVDYHLRAAAWRDGVMYPLELSRDPRVTLASRRYVPGGIATRLRLARLLLLMFLRRRDLEFAEFDRIGDLDGESLAGYAIPRFGRDVLEYFLQPAASSLSCAQPEDMCAANGLSLTWHILSGVFKGFAALSGGVGTLADALERDCEDSIVTGTPARRIVIDGGAAKGVETDGGFIEADAVVCATTATTALRLLPGLPDSLKKPLETVRYSACCHAMFALENRIAPEGTYAVSIPRVSRSSIVSVGLDSAKSPRYAPPGCELAHAFTFGTAAFELNGMPDAEVESRLVDQMRGFFPDFPERPLFCRVHRWREALCFYPPGMVTALARTPREGAGEITGLHLCGEYMRIPGTVEGAFRSGLAAARAVSAWQGA